MAPLDPFNESAVVDWLEVEKAVEAYESARAQNKQIAFRNFLPERHDPLYERVLRELVRIELEASWTQGKPRFLEQYRDEFPCLFGDRQGLGELAFEEYRLRRLAGENATPEEYEARYQIDAAGWPEWNRLKVNPSSSREAPARNDLPQSETPRNPSLEAAAQSYMRLRLEVDEVSVANLNSWIASCTAEPEKAAFFRDLHISAPDKASLLAEGLTQLPEAGTEFLGFRLVTELGRGAFGRVYLARQGDLANRSVALKVAADVFDESQKLAQLQHTNIVPIYSIHRSGNLQAVCMPYFGATTLADILSHVESQPSLPDSGKFVVSTLNNRRASTQQNAGANQSSDMPSVSGLEEKAPLPTAAENSDSEGILRQLAGYSYVQAVLWMSSRLADGLAHAHERGILHRDLKPANILLTDEGQPMLLDFNLSADLKGQAHRAIVGGTLPYMSPEHLEVFRGRQRVMDARSDIYALGVMIYELLGGKRPFPTFRGESDSVLGRMVDDRLKGPPSLRKLNPDVTAAVEAIVFRCLAPTQEKRYQNAGDLHEDLERHLKDLPLKHTPEPSITERCGKWMRRHPRLASTTSVSLAACLVIVMLGAGWVMRGKELARLEAAENLGSFRTEMNKAELLANLRNRDAESLNQSEAECRRALAHYGLPENTKWRDLPVVRYLSPDDHVKLQGSLGELLFWLAKTTALQANYQTAEQKSGRLELAMNLSSLSESCYGPERTPRELLEHRRTLATALGREQEAKAIAAILLDFQRKTPKDSYWGAHRFAIDGNVREALRLLQKATQDNPANLSAWFVRGNCYADLQRFGDAVGCFNVCVALRPDYPQCWFSRGLAHLEAKNFRQASEDFTKAIELKPDMVDGYASRSIAFRELREYPQAIADLTAALEIKGCPSMVYFLRARVYRLMKKNAEAEADKAAGLREAPTDAQSWVARGFARISSDPKLALADFDEALKLNSHCFEALQNKAAILADKFHKDDESLAVMNEAVRLFPDSVLTRGGRGVLLARQGKRKEALGDAEEALLLDSAPPTLYQVACIYALTSKNEPADQVKALNLLSEAIRTGFALEWIDEDHDLDPLRKLPEFGKAVAAARALANKTKSPAH